MEQAEILLNITNEEIHEEKRDYTLMTSLNLLVLSVKQLKRFGQFLEGDSAVFLLLTFFC